MCRCASSMGIDVDVDGAVDEALWSEHRETAVAHDCHQMGIESWTCFLDRTAEV
jgi:hypothetical protein